MKEKYHLYIFLLFALSILSSDLFWNLLSLWHNKRCYIAFRFLFTAAYFIISIVLTSNIKVFQDFWNRHKSFKSIFEKFLHICTVFIVYILFNIPILLDSLLGNAPNSQNKEAMNQRIMEIDGKPLIVRTLSFPALVFLILLVLIQFEITNDSINKWIISVLDFQILLLNFFFLTVSVKEWAFSQKDITCDQSII